MLSLWKIKELLNNTIIYCNINIIKKKKNSVKDIQHYKLRFFPHTASNEQLSEEEDDNDDEEEEERTKCAQTIKRRNITTFIVATTLREKRECWKRTQHPYNENWGKNWKFRKRTRSLLFRTAKKIDFVLTLNINLMFFLRSAKEWNNKQENEFVHEESEDNF